MTIKLKPLSQTLLLTGLVSHSFVVLAEDVKQSPSLEQLQQQIDSLQEQLQQQQQAYEKDRQDDRANIIAKTNGRSLKFESNDGEFSAQIGGRFQADAAFYGSDIPSGDATDIRRLFLDLSGQFYQDWGYRFQYDFARSGESSSSRGIRDAYLKYDGLEQGSITVGQFKTPFGLEHLTSSLNSTFLERGLNHLFSPDRRLGVGFDTYSENWTASIGEFGSPVESETSSGQDQDEGWNLIGRITTTPIKTDKSLIHLGVAIRQNWAQDSDKSQRYRARPEVEADGNRLIDTGLINQVDELQAYGLEFASVVGPFSVQAEYTQTKLQRSSSPDLKFDGWYVFTSYFLTGESRPYKKGVFDRIKPLHAVGNGGIGAWELAARYSTADLNDADIYGGELDNATLGLNWYTTDNVRFSANYIRVLDVNRPGSDVDGIDGDILALRAQFDF